MYRASDLLSLLRRLQRCYDRQVSEMGARYGLTATEVSILLFLDSHPQKDTARDIAELRGLPKSCVSRAVDSLIRQGFLTSCEDIRDRRILHLSIQPAADRLMADARTTQEDFFRRICRGFSPQEQKICRQLAQKLSDNLHTEECSY
ncbi:MAG: MarR family winged helix-turn-helix transcriptional regulator [Eubacteriales bacterium]|nr:MarR family winged helix-turn-helix transcriptional regulator [Eubacteriales bacterium]